MDDPAKQRTVIPHALNAQAACDWLEILHRHVLYVLFSGLHVQSTVCLSGFALEAGHEGISCNCQNSNIDSCAPRAAAVSMQVVIPTSQIRSGAFTTRFGAHSGRMRVGCCITNRIHGSSPSPSPSSPEISVPSDRRVPVGWQPVSDLVYCLLAVHVQITPFGQRRDGLIRASLPETPR